MVWKEGCIVSSVIQPLLAPAQMLRGGWIEFGIILRHEDSGFRTTLEGTV